MGLFKKKEEKKEVAKHTIKDSIPQLPELPKLPSLPGIPQKIHQLPSIPSNSFGDKFAQHSIKEAVSGEKEVDEAFDANDFDIEDEDYPMMPRSQKELPEMKQEKIGIATSPRTRELEKAEPLFIRIDKFEESLKTFEKIRKQIGEMEELLSETKRMKEKEEGELEMWEKEIQNIKKETENIDKDIFSRIE